MFQLVGHLAHWYLGSMEFLHVLRGPPYLATNRPLVFITST